MKIGCPAISFSSGIAEIKKELCVGCELCTRICEFDAIKKEA
jgi:indolepyruvate ferredoxin oxidoreductase alpha subunit